MPLVRLDKMITDTGLCSRSRAKELVRQGRVTVDGAPVSDASEKFDPAASAIAVDGELLGETGHLYVMLHKPAGLLSATRDPRKPTVLDLMPPEWKRRGLFPVGRLDKDTTGLLILTDDGDFAHRVISPKSRVPKLYEAAVEGSACAADVEAFSVGLLLADGTRCLPAQLESVGPGRVRVVVFEGKYHQVKRMLASRRLPVLSLSRLRIGELPLDPALHPGEYRLLKNAELSLILPGFLSK